MKKLSNAEAELKKSFAYKKACIPITYVNNKDSIVIATIRFVCSQTFTENEALLINEIRKGLPANYDLFLNEQNM